MLSSLKKKEGLYFGIYRTMATVTYMCILVSVWPLQIEAHCYNDPQPIQEMNIRDCLHFSCVSITLQWYQNKSYRQQIKSTLSFFGLTVSPNTHWWSFTIFMCPFRKFLCREASVCVCVKSNYYYLFLENLNSRQWQMRSCYKNWGMSRILQINNWRREGFTLREGK